MHGSKYEYAPCGAVYETSSVRHVLVGDVDTQEVVQAQVVLPLCMGIVAKIFDAWSRYHNTQYDFMTQYTIFMTLLIYFMTQCMYIMTQSVNP